MSISYKKVIQKINNALKGLTQQEAYDIICYYKKQLKDKYPMIENGNKN